MIANRHLTNTRNSESTLTQVDDFALNITFTASGGTIGATTALPNAVIGDNGADFDDYLVLSGSFASGGIFNNRRTGEIMKNVTRPRVWWILPTA